MFKSPEEELPLGTKLTFEVSLENIRILKVRFFNKATYSRKKKKRQHIPFLVLGFPCSKVQVSMTQKTLF